MEDDIFSLARDRGAVAAVGAIFLSHGPQSSLNFSFLYSVTVLAELDVVLHQPGILRPVTIRSSDGHLRHSIPLFV